MSFEYRILNAPARDLRKDAVDELGRLKVMPSRFYEQATTEERAALGQRMAAYGLPTEELVAWLRLFINGRTAIEIGSGNGVLAQALGIPATDSCMQRRPEIAAYYRLLGQPVVQYGSNVIELDAHAAVAKYKPKVVIASWVTHKFDPAREQAGGNQEGVVEEEVITACENYVAIGNDHVHRNKSIWSLPHKRLHPPWLHSRAHNGSKDFIAVWGPVPQWVVSEAL